MEKLERVNNKTLSKKHRMLKKDHKLFKKEKLAQNL